MPPRHTNSSSHLQYLLKELSDEESDTGLPEPTHNESEPWVHGFQQYLETAEDVPKGMTIVEWWGVSAA
jgi:hypothetical protein